MSKEPTEKLPVLADASFVRPLKKIQFSVQRHQHIRLQRLHAAIRDWNKGSEDGRVNRVNRVNRVR